MIRTRIFLPLAFSSAFAWLANIALAQQPIASEAISIEQGLSQGMAYDLLQDREGFLWVATKDGLNRYDGYGFKVFTNDPYDPFSLSSNTVMILFEDSKGHIWVGTESAGLNVYDKKSGRFFRILHQPNDTASLSGNRILSIGETPEGQILVGVMGGALNVLTVPDDFFDKNKLPAIHHLIMPEGQDAVGIAKDTRDRVWISDGVQSIYRFDPSAGRLIEAIRGYAFARFLNNPDGTIWCAGAIAQIPFLWDGQQAQRIPVQMSNTTGIAKTKDGQLWIVDIEGLTIMDMSKWTPGMPWSAEQKAVRYSTAGVCMTQDRAGNMWIASGGYGLQKINFSRSRFQQDAQGVSMGSITTLSDRPLWFSFGLIVDANWTFHSFPGEQLITRCFPGKIIENHLLVTKSGKYVTRAETPRYEVELIQYDPVARSTSSLLIPGDFWDKQPILESASGKIWMAGYNGALGYFDPLSGKFLAFNFSDPAQPMPPRTLSTALYEDTDGTLWVGAVLGFVRAIPGSQDNEAPQFQWFKTNHQDRNSLNYNHVTCFLNDPAQPERYLWISTKGGGLNRMDKKSGKFLHLTTANGLPNNVVYGILADDLGNIWGSTNRGIFCMSQTNGQFTFRNFTKADGLQDDEFNTGSYARLPGGKLAFGGINGLNIFDPKEVLSGDFQPKVFLTNILVNNQPVAPGDASGVLKYTLETSESITLTHEQDILTLEFAALDFSAPQHNRYRYQLVGVDPDWVESGTRRNATYLHLPPGNYAFRVQGSNSHGTWSPHIAELNICVLPPWWRTWLAYLAYLVLLGAGIRAYFKFSVNRARLRAQLSYETREAERMKFLDALKTRLYTNITHEFRTPLTIILGMARQALQNPMENFRNSQEMILRNGEQLLKLVNEMLDLSKLESGKMTLQPVQGDIINFLKYLLESFHSMAESHKLQLHFLSDLDALTMDYDPEKLRQVISNLLSNAIKFTPAGGHIYVHVSRQNLADKENLFIKVTDTGIGIPEAELPNVFDRFYQVDDSNTRQQEGTGIGLTLTRELVKLMAGEITVKSPPPGAQHGSEFSVELSIQRIAALNTVQEVQDALSSEFPETTVRAPDTRNNEADLASPIILIVEDNADVVAYLSTCLSMYRLLISRNGQEGLDRAMEIVPDIVISDVMMPVMDGFELCRRLKTDERTDHIPIILLTARADFESKIEGLELGADAYLAKPFAAEELLVRLKKLLELRRQLQRHYLQAAGLTQGAMVIQNLPDLRKADDAFVKKVREVVESHLDDYDFNITQMCRELLLSQSQLHRKLEALTGYSPNQFIRYVRLNKARELLRNTDLSVMAVALECGFSDPAYFARVFKQELGVTPVEWRASGE